MSRALRALRARPASRGAALVRALAPGLLAVVVLTACSGTDEGAGGSASGSSATAGSADATEGADGAAPTSGATQANGYLPVPDQVSLTAPGTELEHGQSATVAWELPGGDVGVVDLVVDRVREVRRSVFAGWLPDDGLSDARPYFVDVSVQNRGTTDLGGQGVPLYLLADQTLVPPSTFGGRFEPCASRPLPRSFLEGDEVERCLVYLAPRGRIEAMSFDPVEGFDAITWQGKVARPDPGEGRTQRGGGDRDR